MPDYDPALALSESEAERWNTLIALRADVNKALEAARAEKRIGKSLEAAVTLHLPVGYRAAKSGDPAFLADLFIVSGVTLGDDTQDGEVAVDVAAAEGKKCARCWKFHRDVGEDELCPRCAAVVKAMDLQ